ncbi:Integral membrane protein [Mycena kentingensis (nom. inval.)]|nr:Integral membrane protein [Mycena kentingensis (nom. inval.)]
MIHLTTGHAQDFRDVSGDRAVKRKTLPMLLPSPVARWSLAWLLLLWSQILTTVWAPPFWMNMVLFSLAAATGVRFIRAAKPYPREAADAAAYWWYNMWLVTAHVLPLFTTSRFNAWRSTWGELTEGIQG